MDGREKKRENEREVEKKRRNTGMERGEDEE